MAITKTDVYDVQAPFLLDLRNRKADINARNAIGTYQRDSGLLCYTIAENVLWMLTGGLSNSDWVQIWPAVGTTQSVVVNTAAPTGGNDGDIWFRQVGETVTVYQRAGGTWAALGVIETGSPTPTLQEVTDEGSTTTNTKTAEGFNANTYANVNGAIGVKTDEARITFQDDIQNYSHLNLHSNIVRHGGHISVLSAGTSGAPTYGSLSTDILTSSRVFTLPDKSGTVALLDDILPATTYTPDPSLPNPPTLAYLNTNYPSAKIGDIVYREGATQIIEATCYASGKWNWIMKNRVL